jgi:hypothetical protein
LVDRGDVLIVGGKGGPGDPRRYVTVERIARIGDGRGAENGVGEADCCRAGVLNGRAWMSFPDDDRLDL